MSINKNPEGKNTGTQKGHTRRQFMGSIATIGLGGLAIPSISNATAATPLVEKANDIMRDLKITRIRWYKAPSSPMTNQSMHVVTVETDKGITGIGEGGTASLVSELAQLLIGENPLRIEHLWQLMYRSYFYPPGREKIHALGALDLALWDIKGKVLGLPLYELFGSKVRNYLECYPTGFRGAPGASLKDNAKACMDQGFRAFRTDASGPRGDAPFTPKESIIETVKKCEQIREGVGPTGDWCIDFHTRLDMMDAVTLANLLEPLRPMYIEDPIRSENKKQYEMVREKINVPLAVGEHYGDKWDFNELIEADLFDHSRVTIPNCGGVSEFMKISALCEMHYVGLIPHFTGPIATSALVHVCSTYPGPVLMEAQSSVKRDIPHLPQHFDFREGKMWTNERPGIGVEVDFKQIELVAEVTEKKEGLPIYKRPDGSITNW